MKKCLSVFMSALLALSLLPFSSCGKDSGEFPVTVSGVTINKAPQSVVSLSSSLTDIICLMKYDYLLVGRSQNCNFESVADLPACGTSDSPDTGTIVSLNPDVVLTDRELPVDSADYLFENDITVVVLSEATGRATLKQLYASVGAILGGATTGQSHGNDVADKLLIALDDVQRLSINVPVQKTIAYFDDVDGMRIATGDTFMNLILESSGGINVASEGENWSFSSDYIKLANPDVIICPEDIAYDLRRNTEFINITAVKNRDIYGFDESLLKNQGADALTLCSEISKVLYPELYQDTVKNEE